MNHGITRIKTLACSHTSIVSSMTQLQELILSSSPSLLMLHDLQTGSQTVNFKNANLITSMDSTKISASLDVGHRRTCDYVEAKNGLGGLIMSYGGQGKGYINAWTFGKVRPGSPLPCDRADQDEQEAPAQKSLMTTRLNCLCLSHSGNYLLAGDKEGRVLIWQASVSLIE